jgi:hypothetical protein
MKIIKLNKLEHIIIGDTETTEVSIPSCNMISWSKNSFEEYDGKTTIEISELSLGCVGSSACETIYVKETIDQIDKMMEAVT